MFCLIVETNTVRMCKTRTESLQQIIFRATPQNLVMLKYTSESRENRRIQKGSGTTAERTLATLEGMV